MKQEDIFSETEANAWFSRNKEALKSKTRDKDITYQHLKQVIPELNPKKILEIGCSNGYRLNWLSKDFSVQCIGIEPSLMAVADGQKRFQDNNKLELIGTKVNVDFWRSGFNNIFKDNSLDIVIFGHSLYLVPPEMYFLITYQIDRVLKDQGIVVIFDFDSYPQRREYEPYKAEAMWSYKMDFSTLFSRHPMYKLISKNYVNYVEGLSVGNAHNDCSLSIIRKIDKVNAFVQII